VSVPDSDSAYTLDANREYRMRDRTMPPCKKCRDRKVVWEPCDQCPEGAELLRQKPSEG